MHFYKHGPCSLCGCRGGGLRRQTPSPGHAWLHLPFELSGCNQQTWRALWLGCDITLTSAGSLAPLTGPTTPPLGSWIIQRHEVVHGVSTKAPTGSMVWFSLGKNCTCGVVRHTEYQLPFISLNFMALSEVYSSKGTLVKFHFILGLYTTLTFLDILQKETHIKNFSVVVLIWKFYNNKTITARWLIHKFKLISQQYRPKKTETKTFFRVGKENQGIFQWPVLAGGMITASKLCLNVHMGTWVLFSYGLENSELVR